MAKLFGTDGIRGVANEQLTAQLAFNLGRAFGVFLNNTAKTRKILIGRDTRVSGQMLSSAFSAGLNSVGFQAVLPGIVTTPSLSYLTKISDVDGGVMITASHNPAEHNGLKFFNVNGEKLNKQEQAEIEEILNNIDSYLGCEPLAVGGYEINEDMLKIWVDHLLESINLPKLNGLKIALDTANGASFAVAPYIFKKLGAKVFAYNNQCNGACINKDCGSLHLDKFVADCVANDVYLGLSFDGDADRVMAVTNKGSIYDGTDLMYIFAKYMKKHNILKDDTVVSTIVTNCGLENSLAKDNIKFVRTQVGGLYIQQEMLKNGYNLGGEENGHLMLGDIESESDGIASGLSLLKVMLEEDKSIPQLLEGLNRTLTIKSDVAVSLRQKQAVDSGCLNDLVAELESELGNSGRIVVRTSGTENLVRVLVEGEDEKELSRLNDIIVAKIEEI